MNESLLQFIWQFQYFKTTNLQTTEGEAITLIQPGYINVNQGPDFLNAKVVIGDNTWAGNIELHILTSDWNKHKHSGDKNYSNVILHVVWKNDLAKAAPNQTTIPVLELQHCVSKILLERYDELMNKKTFVPCDNHLPVLDSMKWLAWKERLAVERLQRKSNEILESLTKANNHWEEVFWWKLAGNFGIKVNAEIFENIATSIPVNILAKHKNQIHQLESLLLGQAGLLNHDFEEEYPAMLKKEYLFYQKKYKLIQIPLAPFFLRMRPANFPTIRLAQLAMLIQHSVHLFSKIKELQTVKEVRELLDVTANDYWHYHYMFDQPTAFHPKKLGLQMIENIIINTIIPILFAHGLFTKNEVIKEKAVKWLFDLGAEKNAITKTWSTLGVTNKNALESQALIELKNSYCKQTRCLECAVGNALMKEKG